MKIPEAMLPELANQSNQLRRCYKVQHATVHLYCSPRQTCNMQMKKLTAQAMSSIDLLVALGQNDLVKQWAKMAWKNKW